MTNAGNIIFGIAAISAHGRRYVAGDVEGPFSVQSISKPFVYAIAVEEHGIDTVHDHVGAEPSGQPFNAISLDEHGRPANPMINAVNNSAAKAMMAILRMVRAHIQHPLSTLS